MNYSKKQIERIKHYEELFDKITFTINNLNSSIIELKNLKPEIDELTSYYNGKMWKKDFSDDEKGLIPPDLKRGVLSEDGIYNILEELEQLKELLKGVCYEVG